jgi:hypothetical protein
MNPERPARKPCARGDQVPPDWDFMYLIEVMDTKGNGAIYPNLECETPYVVVPLHGDRP